MFDHSNDILLIVFYFSDPYVPDRPPLPLITSRKVEYPSLFLPTKQAWLDTMATLEDEKLGILDLHPKIFGAYPR